MALFKRKETVIDLTAAHACPSCGGPGSADYVDLVLQRTSYTCRRCARLWETSAQTVSAGTV